MKTLKALLIPCLLLLTASAAMAQPQAESQPAQHAADHHKVVAPQFFRLKFVVKELEGKKVIDSRIFTTEISALPAGVRSGPTWHTDRSIRADARIPVTTGSYQTGPASGVVSSLVNTQYHYVNVGVDLDCVNPVIIGQKLAMLVTAHVRNVTSGKILQSATGVATRIAAPVFSDNHWSSEVLIPTGQPTVLFTSEEPTSIRTVELDVVATPIH